MSHGLRLPARRAKLPDVTVPQRITFVTLGARDLPALRRFYGALGWTEAAFSTESFAAFECGSVRLSLYPIEALRDEAAPGEDVPPPGWNGVALAVNVADRDEVDRTHAAAVAAGATVVTEPEAREWGGYSGYVADPEGNRWEVAWAPGLPLD